MGSRSINKLTGLDSSSEMREKVVVMMIVFINPVSVSISSVYVLPERGRYQVLRQCER